MSDDLSARACVVRRAVPADIDALEAIENACFASDRLSRRSLRELLRAATAILQVAERNGVLLGYSLLLFRKGTAAARLYSIAVLPDARGGGLARRLLQAAEDAAYQAGRGVLRLEVACGNEAAGGLYRAAGYRYVETLDAYYQDGSDGLRLEKRLRGTAPAQLAGSLPRYYAQTTEFTCGPACLLMALSHFDPAFVPTPVSEIRLWREATTVFMSSGLGGCEPFGMAVALAERGLRTELFVNVTGPLLLKTVVNAEKRRVMELAQVDFKARAKRLGIPLRQRVLDARSLARRLRAGAVAAVLISGNRMFGQRVPHWVLACGADDGHVVIHDPWVDDKRLESETDAQAIPIPFEEFDRMSRWGKAGLRAVVLIDRMPGPANQHGVDAK